MKQNDVLTQRKRIGDRLKMIAPDISAKDRKDFIASLGENKISAPTLSRYLSGDVADPETGLGILFWFHSKVQSREAMIDKI